MEDCDAALEEGREDLALDRPPVVLSSSPNKSPNLLRRENSREKEKISSDSETSKVIEESFDPLSCSEKKHESELEDQTESDTRVVEQEPEKELNVNEELSSAINRMGSSKTSVNPNSTIPVKLVASSTIVQSEKTNMPPSKKTGGRSRFSYTPKQPLTSCLKKTAEGSKSSDPQSKNVHYPQGDDVAEFIEPVDPWRDVRTPSKGEVISFYRNTCQKLRCKPIDKVMKQIQEIPDMSARAGTLVLRGTRLDVRSCEALESIFRRVQFENLDLENCSLEEDGATAVLEMIEFYNSTCKLNIACNPKIGIRGWQTLCRMLRKTHTLTYLDARRTLLTDMTMPTFGRCLKADPNLKILHLEGVFLSGRPLLILTTAMKYNKILEELYLGDNDLTSSDGPPIGAMLTYNTTLQLLDLRNNQMKDIGLAHIGNGLADQSEQIDGGLCSLIMWNNGLTHEGMSYLCEGLIRTTSLKALNLGQNRLGDLGLQKLKGGLLKNKSLRKLGFLNTKIGSEGAVALAEVLADSLTITRIDIRENNIQTAGLMAFSMALKVNQSLLRLDLDKDIKKEPGMESVMQTVLVDIYNLCYRNKQLARHSLSSSTSSISSDPNATHSHSQEAPDTIPGDDVFHPEACKQEIVPFSPADNPEMIVFPEHFAQKKTADSMDSIPPKDNKIVGNTSVESLGNSVDSVFTSPKRNRSISDPIGRKNPDPAPQAAKRASRFSVTKIIDSLTSGVANKIATNIDHKFKKQPSKDIPDHQPKQAELLPVVEQRETEQIALNPLNSSNDSNFEILNDDLVVPDKEKDLQITNEIITEGETKNQEQTEFLRTNSAPERLTGNTEDNLEISSSHISSGDNENHIECTTTSDKIDSVPLQNDINIIDSIQESYKDIENTENILNHDDGEPLNGSSSDHLTSENSLVDGVDVSTGDVIEINNDDVVIGEDSAIKNDDGGIEEEETEKEELNGKNIIESDNVSSSLENNTSLVTSSDTSSFCSSPLLSNQSTVVGLPS